MGAAAGMMQMETQYAFSAPELAEFASSFDLVREKLPRLFRAHWHRWSYMPGKTPAVLVYGENGQLALCLVREDQERYGAIGITVPGHVQYWPPRPTISEALNAAGLL